jgi:hypothetical protein
MRAEADAVLRWLALVRSRRWLMIFDNVDRDVRPGDDDAQAYDVMSFLSAVGHGSVLITIPSFFYRRDRRVDRG